MSGVPLLFSTDNDADRHCFGFHRTTVARHLKQAEETLRTNPADPAFQEQVRQAYAELGTVKHTAQRLGVSKDAVRKVVRGE